MSLWEFIWATVKDIQVAATKRTELAEQPLLQPVRAEDKKGEEDVPALVRKKSRRIECAEIERDAVGKRRKKEKAKKAEYEQPKERNEETVEEKEENRVAINTELPRTLSMEIPKATTSAPIDVEEIEEPLERHEEGTDQRPYVRIG